MFRNLLLTAMVVAATLPAFGAMTFSASETIGGSVYSAAATVSLEDDLLTILLTNTSLGDVLVPQQILTGMFFDLSDDVSLTPLSALLDTGSSVLFAPAQDVAGNAITGGTYANGDVGAEWAFASVNGPRGAGYGISSSGLGLFGKEDRFDTGANRNLQGPDSPNGLQYGITSAGDISNSGNSAVTGASALINGGVLFAFMASPGFQLEDISNVSFQYGTSLSEPNISYAPEPSTMALLITGLVGFAFRRRFAA